MNLLVENVVSDITGKTGMAIMRAIVEGERAPEKLARHRDPRCKSTEEVIAKSLQGHYREEHLFCLGQAMELYDMYQDKLCVCDEAIERQLNAFAERADPAHLCATAKSRRKAKNTPGFDVRAHLYRVSGVDLTRIDGIDSSTALSVVSETGFDMSRWKTGKHFSSWLSLSPWNKISGGRVLTRRTKRSTNRAAAALRMAAFGLVNSKSALGAFYRRMRARVGAPKAITATAHKLARLIYSMLKHGTEYVDRGQDYYEQQYRERVVTNLRKRAAQLGFALMPSTLEQDSPRHEGSMA